jgi:hypothetical protein
MARKNSEIVEPEQAVDQSTDAEVSGDPLEDAVEALDQIEAEREEAQVNLAQQESQEQEAEVEVEAEEAEEEEYVPAVEHVMAGVPRADLQDDGTFKPGLKEWHELYNPAYPGFCGERGVEVPDKPTGEAIETQSEEE